MRLKDVFTPLAVMFITCSLGFAHQLPAQRYSETGVSKRFLDAHAPAQPTYSRSEVKKMIRDAKTSEDFNRLADYFDCRSMEFEKKSQEQVKELQRLLALPYHAKTYQSQVDYTRELIKRYKVQA